jgi:2-oxoglutarate ferredoxin oxidoreductase subunit delta
MTKRAPILSEPFPALGDVHIKSEHCKGCELCIDYCPTKILALSEHFNAKGYHYPEVVSDNCINCQACYTICPEFAIFATPREKVDTPNLERGNNP